jgi:hypothetical protein
MKKNQNHRADGLGQQLLVSNKIFRFAGTQFFRLPFAWPQTKGDVASCEQA